MRNLCLLIILWSNELLAQISRKSPILIPLGKDSPGYLAYSDLNELKNYILAGLGGLAVFIIKELFSWWKNRNNTEAKDQKEFQQKVMAELIALKEYALIHKYELQHLKENKASVSEVHEIIRDRLDFVERKK